MTVEVRITSAARRQLYEEVVRLRETDRDAAARFVLAVEARLEDLGRPGGEGDEIRSVPAAPSDEWDHRLYTRVRGPVVWVIAVGPRAPSGDPEEWLPELVDPGGEPALGEPRPV